MTNILVDYRLNFHGSLFDSCINAKKVICYFTRRMTVVSSHQKFMKLATENLLYKFTDYFMEVHKFKTYFGIVLGPSLAFWEAGHKSAVAI